tara:strand:- start:789 stop:947 length:159 start_codon:yes stop_codon:yes gene_type:complete
MTKIKEKKEAKQVKREYVALKALCTSNGMVKKGELFTCSNEEYKKFKSVEAV